MKLKTSILKPAKCRADVYIVPVFEGADAGQTALKYGFGASAARVIKKLKPASEFKKITTATLDEKEKVVKIILIGAGSIAKFDAESIREVAGTAQKAAMAQGGMRIATGCWSTEKAKIAAQAEGMALATYAFNKFKSAKKIEKKAEITICGKNAGVVINEAQKVCEAVFFARDLMNSPSNVATPGMIEKEARSIRLTLCLCPPPPHSPCPQTPQSPPPIFFFKTTTKTQSPNF